MTERKFIVTSTKFDGAITFNFALNGFLKEFKITAQLSPDKHKAVLVRVPLHISNIKKLNELGNVDIEEVSADLSFDNFLANLCQLRRQEKSLPHDVGAHERDRSYRSPQRH